MLTEIGEKPQTEGYSKPSLTVDVKNERTASLYGQTGFHIMEKVEIKFLKQRIGYTGFYRMMKEII